MRLGRGGISEKRGRQKTQQDFEKRIGGGAKAKRWLGVVSFRGALERGRKWPSAGLGGVGLLGPGP